MNNPVWQLKNPISTLIFDCDGTLSSVEGIDELAKENGVGAAVKALTQKAMGETGLNNELYQKRLALVKPSRAQVDNLAQIYFARRTADISAVLQLLQRLHKDIFIVSAGLTPAVVGFGKLLKVPAQNIFSVGIRFDAQGDYQTYDAHSPMVTNTGKKQVVAEIKAKTGAVIYMGDGMNDLAVAEIATRFIGYGGAYFHEKVAAASQYYIKTSSATAFLPLVLTAQETQALDATEAHLYQQGMAAIADNQVIIR